MLGDDDGVDRVHKAQREAAKEQGGTHLSGVAYTQSEKIAAPDLTKVLPMEESGGNMGRTLGEDS